MSVANVLSILYSIPLLHFQKKNVGKKCHGPEHFLVPATVPGV